MSERETRHLDEHGHPDEPDDYQEPETSPPQIWQFTSRDGIQTGILRNFDCLDGIGLVAQVTLPDGNVVNWPMGPALRLVNPPEWVRCEACQGSGSALNGLDSCDRCDGAGEFIDR